MGLVVKAILEPVELLVIALVFTVQGSGGSNISPSLAIFPGIPTIIEGIPHPVHQGTPLRSNAPSSELRPKVPNLHPLAASSPPKSALVPQSVTGLVPSYSTSSPVVAPRFNPAPPPLVFQGHAPYLAPSIRDISPSYNVASPPSTASVLPPDGYQGNTPVGKTAVPLPSLPVLLPPRNSPVINPGAPKMSPTVSVLPPDGYQRKTPVGETAVPLPSLPVPSPSSNSPQNSPVVNPGAPKMSPTGSVLPPDGYRRKTPVGKTAAPLPSLPVLSPSSKSPQNSPIHSGAPKMSPQSSRPRNKSFNGASVPWPSAPVVFPPRKLAPNKQAGQPIVQAISPSISRGPPVSSIKEIPMNSPALHPIMPGESPSKLPAPDVSHAPNTPSIDWKQNGIPVAAPSDGPHKLLPPMNHLPSKGPGVSQAPTTPSIDRKQSGIPVAAPTNETHEALAPVNHLPTEVSHASTPPPGINWRKDGVPVAAPPDETSKLLPPVHRSPSKVHKAVKHPSVAPVPSQPLPPSDRHHFPAFSPSVPPHEQNRSRNISNSPAPVPSYLMHPPIKENQRPASPPSFLPTSRHIRYAPQSPGPGPSTSAQHQLFPKPETNVSPAPSPSPVTASGWTEMPVLSPKHSSLGSSGPKMPLRPPVQTLPPPPPNEDCSATVCMDPYTNTPPGSPCGCVLPMQVGLRLGVALYTFFPLVSELAQEIAAGVFMKQSQVRIMGANAASRQPEKTMVLIDLVPLGERFDNTTAFLIYQKFWHKEVVIKFSLFGDYDVLYVRYPGLPPSPPSAPSSFDIGDNGPYSGNDNNGRTIKPLGVDVQKRHHKDRLGGGMIAIIALSACVALVLSSAVAWVFLFRHRDHIGQPVPGLQPLPPSIAKSSGTGSMIGSGLSSTSLSFGSSIAPYKGSARTLSTVDLERATNNFDASRILGEGGFGRVYSGTLEDGTKVAVKVLKRDDQQGGREFLAEVEMLSRLHHRNLVKLIGICTEEHARSLVYELIPNGSVDSHLHGVDKESAPLNWDSRIKIALGAARGLAYLHEDSSPRVIHRDFKSSNILLEHDFTAKVSDFGLARTALDEENRHISTRVMGTFGYVAPEYAMTGHLLVKSDVYSYGVVLLELLTGRKPVNMSRPPGQENLVAWARPFLTSKEGLEIIIDPSLGPVVPFDTVAKVAAIASMCVQPEVSNRPFMGEVVQALKLVCNECDEAKEVASRSSSQDMSADMDTAICTGPGNLPQPFHNQSLSPNYGSEPDIERGLSRSELFSASVINGRQASGSLRRYSNSGPLTTGKGRWFWQRTRSLSVESVSEHRAIFRLWPGSH